LFDDLSESTFKFSKEEKNKIVEDETKSNTKGKKLALDQFLDITKGNKFTRVNRLLDFTN